jgi:hypothetical protein
MKFLIIFALIIFTALQVQSNDLPKMQLIKTKKSNGKSTSKTPINNQIAEPLKNFFDFY